MHRVQAGGQIYRDSPEAKPAFAVKRQQYVFSFSLPAPCILPSCHLAGDVSMVFVLTQPDALIGVKVIPRLLGMARTGGFYWLDP